jgi:hypothetical protein
MFFGEPLAQMEPGFRFNPPLGGENLGRAGLAKA